LAILVAAAMPDLAEQAAAGAGPTPAVPRRWPWSGDALHNRVMEARSILADRQRRQHDAIS
jgi:hypothetical protein